MYDSNFSDRLDIAIEKIGGIGKACSVIGVSYPTIGRWKEGTSDPKLSNVVAFAEAAKVSLDWLVNGEGEQSIDQVNQHRETYVVDTLDDEYIYVPAYDIEVSAGHGSYCLGQGTPDKFLAFRKHWVTARGLHAKSLAAMFTKGDSMTPTIPESAAIVIDRDQNKALDGKVYVIRIDDRHYVKRTQWLIGGGLRLISDNKLYDALDITKADMEASNIEICGQVIHASYDLPD